MIVIVIILNLIITIFNLYLAIKLWQLRKLLTLITSALIKCENYLYYVFLVTPPILQKEQTNIYHFRQRYQLWQLQLKKIKQIIVLLNWFYRLWCRYRVTV
jgi:ABC-type glucose/galactose transport system permease subunit